MVAAQAAPKRTQLGGSSIVRRKLPYNVVEGARKRIINAFSNGVQVHMGMSGGKDSIALASVVLDLVKSGKIDKSLLTVIFIDEEAMHDSIIDSAKDWRRRFIAEGVAFEWYCIEVRHFSCFNALEQDESFICWDSTQRENWVRPMPPFAITDHPLLVRRVDNFQAFLAKRSRAAIQMNGVRVAESVQRLQFFRNRFTNPDGQLYMPIYDWKDTDVWRYIRDHDLKIPEVYFHLYQTGTSRRGLRVSQFFSIDTARSLVKIAEYDATLMERITKREPNAYLASLYWDTDMFRSGKSRNSKVAAEEEEQKDYRAMAIERIRRDIESDNKYRRATARNARIQLMKFSSTMTTTDWATLYRALEAGDPKGRTLRALANSLQGKASDASYT